MHFKHQISITADSKVGSTTTSKKLHEILGHSPWRRVNVGGLMRIIAKEKGMTIEEFSAYATEHPEEKYDEKCDGMLRHFGEHDYVISEGRLAHYFSPSAFHVRLVCDPKIRAERQSKDIGWTVDETYKKIIDREVINTKRYLEVYGEEVLWPNEKFDLVLDTGVDSPDVIVQKILDGHQKWVDEKGL